MSRKYTTPLTPKEEQERRENGIPAGMRCQVMMQGATPRMVWYSKQANAPTRIREAIGQCPRLACRWKNGEPRCSAHGKAPRS